MIKYCGKNFGGIAIFIKNIFIKQHIPEARLTAVVYYPVAQFETSVS